MTSAFREIRRMPRIPESMDRARERFVKFLFPVVDDGWVTILRIGLGIQVVLYALSLKDDWNFLFAGSEQGLIGRAFSEALLQSKVHSCHGSAGWSGWARAPVCRNGQSFLLPGGCCLSLSWGIAHRYF